MSARVLFGPCSVDGKGDDAHSFVVVRRPVLRSSTGRVLGHVAERLSILIEAFAAHGPREVVGIDAEDQPIYGRREPIWSKIVWCSADDRDRWDRGTGGAPGKPRGGTSFPVTAYLTADAHAVAAAIEQARRALELHAQGVVALDAAQEVPSLDAAVAVAEEEALLAALSLTRGNVQRAAPVLGVSLATVHRLVKRHRDSVEERGTVEQWAIRPGPGKR